MGQGDGLGLLQMGVSGHDGMQVPLRDVQNRLQQLPQHHFRFAAGGLGVHPGVQGHLVIPAAAGMQALARVPDALNQQGFHVGMMPCSPSMVA